MVLNESKNLNQLIKQSRDGTYMFKELFSDKQDSNFIWSPEVNDFIMSVCIKVFTEIMGQLFLLFLIINSSLFHSPFIILVILLKFSNHPLPISILVYDLASCLTEVVKVNICELHECPVPIPGL